MTGCGSYYVHINNLIIKKRANNDSVLANFLVPNYPASLFSLLLIYSFSTSFLFNSSNSPFIRPALSSTTFRYYMQFIQPRIKFVCIEFPHFRAIAPAFPSFFAPLDLSVLIRSLIPPPITPRLPRFLYFFTLFLSYCSTLFH